MTDSPITTVAEMVIQNPSTAVVFQRFGIDFCCRGNRSLEDACLAKALDPQEVLRALEAAESTGDARQIDWSQESLTKLADHIVQTHHEYLTRTLAPLGEMVDKIARVHGENHPELESVRETFVAMRAELESHMMKEEMILFPAIKRLEAGNITGPAVKQIFGPIHVMLAEHDAVGVALAELRSLTHDYAVPADACNTYRAAIMNLEELEKDLHIHIHKENNILFPRAIGSDEEYEQLRSAVEA